MPKKCLPKNSKYYLTRRWGDKEVHIFSKGICPKLNVIARLEFELASYEAAVLYFSPITSQRLSFDVEFF